jgi:predicted amidohydrolase YtcJ
MPDDPTLCHPDAGSPRGDAAGMPDVPLADLVLTGGTVHTVTGAPGRALAVLGGRVVAVGSEDDVRAFLGPRTRCIDLGGRTVVPGFVDAHVHPVQAGLELAACSLTEAGDAATAVRLVAEYAAAHPDEAWITGGGWSMEWFPGGTPSRALLDDALPDRPVLLANRDHHGAWANTAALRLAGVDAATPDPADGRIEREPDGAPQGTLHEGAVDLVARLVPAPDEDDLLGGLLRAQAHLHALGITGWQDAIVGAFGSMPDVLPTYVRAARSGLLSARVVGALWWDRHRGVEQVPELMARGGEAGGARGTGRFRATTIKIMQDGVAENFTAGMLEPYLDACGCRTANRGLSYVDPAVLDEAVRLLDAEGFQLHVHAIGDRAVREALDALAKARAANGARDLRHHLAHLQVVHPDDVPRFAELSVAANLQALWAAHERQMDELTIPFLGTERAAWQYPFADLLTAGARLCAGSDWPVSSADPLAAMHVAVNRRSPGDSTAEPLLPHQSLTPADFLRAYTAGSAWINHADADTGSLEPGKLADLAVLDDDPLAVPADRIGNIAVTATFVGGRQVYGDES